MDTYHVKRTKISRNQMKNKPVVRNSEVINNVNHKQKYKQTTLTSRNDDRTKTPIIRNKGEKIYNRTINQYPNHQNSISSKDKYSKMQINSVKNKNKKKIFNGAENSAPRSYKHQSNKSSDNLNSIRKNKLIQTNDNNNNKTDYKNNYTHDPNEASHIYKALRNLGKYKLENDANTKSLTDLENETPIETKPQITNGNNKTNNNPKEKIKKKYSIVDYIFKEMKKEKVKKKPHYNVNIKTSTYVVKQAKTSPPSLINSGKKNGVNMVKIGHLPKHSVVVYQNQMK